MNKVSPILQEIKTMFLSSYLENVVTEYSIILKEEDENATTKQVECNCSNIKELLCYKFDKDVNQKVKKGEIIQTVNIQNGELFPFFENIKGLKAIPDFILFYNFHKKTNKENYLFCFLINLKSGVAGSNAMQLKRGKIFADFIIQHTYTSLDLEIIPLRTVSICYKSKNPNQKNQKRASLQESQKQAYYFEGAYLSFYKDDIKDLDNICLHFLNSH